METNKTIFVVTTDGKITSSHTSFFFKKEDAISCLKSIAKDRRNKLGVKVDTDNEVKFSFTIGWEEHKVTFAILEIPIK